jgi:hypothetical protein
MPLSSAVRERCRTFLQPDEELHYLFPATSVQLGKGTLGVAGFLVAVSNLRITVLSCGWLSRNRPTSVWARYPRAIRLGPVDTSLAPTFSIGKLVLETDEEYVPVIRAADAEISEGGFLPADPLPEL